VPSPPWEPLAFATIHTEFCRLGGWQERHQYLFQLANALPVFAQHLRVTEYRVDGCESLVWLVRWRKQARCYWTAWSDSRVVRGLLAIMQADSWGMTEQQLQHWSLDEHLLDMGLERFVSASRRNGLNAIGQHLRTAEGHWIEGPDALFPPSE